MIQSITKLMAWLNMVLAPLVLVVSICGLLWADGSKQRGHYDAVEYEKTFEYIQNQLTQHDTTIKMLYATASRCEEHPTMKLARRLMNTPGPKWANGIGGY